jgi:isoamylase
VVTNAFWEPLDFELPIDRHREPWRRWIDTSLDSPEDIVPWQAAAAVGDPRSYRVDPRSVVVLWRHLENAGDHA